MGIVIPFLVFASILLSITYSLEANTGFVALLIPRTSPKHPLYNTNTARIDIIREKQWVSAERESFFARKRQGYEPQQGVAPIDSEVIMSYFIGTPPVEQLAYPDTGSDIIWLQCQPCVKCFQQEKPIFEPTKSTSYQQISCESPECDKRFGFVCGPKKSGCFYDVSYADYSNSHGVISTDTLNLPETEHSSKFTHPNTLFGCGFNNEKTFTDRVSGVVGLRNVSVSLPGQISAGSFSFCKTVDGGYIRFGPRSTLVGDSTPLFTDRFDQYQIVMEKIAVSKGSRLEYLDVDENVFKIKPNDPNSGVTVDSGTPYTRLVPDVFHALFRKIEDFMEGSVSYRAADFEICYKGSVEVSVETLPSIQFVLDNNVTIKLPNDNIWTEVDGNICLQILPSSISLTTIGFQQLTNYNVGFDLQKNLLWLDYQLGCVF